MDDSFSVKDIKILRGKTGYQIEMPKARVRYGEIAFALDEQTRQMIEQAVIKEYEKVAGKQK